MVKAFTDYPFVLLGDKDGEEAPIRSCHVLSYDGDKYCTILVDGLKTEIKAGYLYRTQGRLGVAEAINPQALPPTLRSE